MSVLGVEAFLRFDNFQQSDSYATFVMPEKATLMS